MYSRSFVISGSVRSRTLSSGERPVAVQIWSAVERPTPKM